MCCYFVLKMFLFAKSFWFLSFRFVSFFFFLRVDKFVTRLLKNTLSIGWDMEWVLFFGHGYFGVSSMIGERC
jgi:hypothetical protein